MHYLYILHSLKVDKYYTGETEHIHVRIDLHKNHHFKNAFTNIANDWEYVVIFPCNSKEDAVYLERFIKRMKSKKFISKLIASPNILKEILEKR